jgi:hypothetical protein
MRSHVRVSKFVFLHRIQKIFPFIGYLHENIKCSDVHTTFLNFLYSKMFFFKLVPMNP